MELRTFHHFNRLAHGIVAKDTARATTQIARAAQRAEEFFKALNQATADYVLTGIGCASENNYPYWVRWDQRSYFQWDRYFAGLAKDLKRPFVFVGYNNHLIVQRRKYTEPLIGAFLLTATERKNRWEHHSGVSYRRTCDRWYFNFQGETQVLLKHWLEECKTNPEYRRALRLS